MQCMSTTPLAWSMEVTTDVSKGPSLQFHMHRVPLEIQFTHRHGGCPCCPDAIFSVYEVTHSDITLPLPQKLIVKHQSTYIEEDLLTWEGKVYSKLAHLQGHVVPKYYGIFDFNYEGKSVRAHVFEQVEGKPLQNCTQVDWTHFDIKKKVSAAVDQLSQAGVIHADLKRAHVILTEPQKNVILIDFDQAKCSEDERKAMVQNNIDKGVFFRQCDR
jgi:predicted Ser/Thr protein kinase